VRRIALALIAAVTVSTAAAGAPSARGEAARDWTRTIAATAEGGYRMGNPDAPVKLVEYVSLTCPTCAAFAREGMPPLRRDYVGAGRVSIEYRNFFLNPYDATAAVLSRCAPAAEYFALTDAILAAQPEWTGRLADLERTELEALSSLPYAQRMGRIAALSGLDRIAARHGVNEEAARACFADEPGLRRLVEMRQVAEGMGVQGTPSFLVNGRLVSAYTWSALAPLLGPPGR
jgi:protein-disulfide isomerase